MNFLDLINYDELLAVVFDFGFFSMLEPVMRILGEIYTFNAFEKSINLTLLDLNMTLNVGGCIFC